MNEDSRVIILAAGGTGGHISPAAALAKDLKSRGYKVVLATDSRGLKFSQLFEDCPVQVIKSGTFAGGIVGKIKGVIGLALGFLQSLRMIDKLSPRIVVGFGGYPSVPAVFAAQKKNIPTIIHEQNAVLGRANLFLAPKADRIALSIKETRGLHEAEIVRTIVTGNPVREDIASLYNKPYPALEDDGPLRLFVLGGSLGASIFADALAPALTKLSAAFRARLDITQQCREEDIEKVRELYKQAGIKARLDTFFDDVPQILEQAHLIIGRSGASTVAEVASAGRPAIFVPYPHHADQQQKMNAESIAAAGGAWVMTQDGFTEDAILARIETFLQNAEILFRSAESARSCGKPDATRRLGNLVTAIAAGWDKEAKRPYDLTQGRDVY